MADKRTLLSNFAKKISELNYSKPKLVKRVFTKGPSTTLSNNSEINHSDKEADTNINANKNTKTKSSINDNDASFVFENSALKAYILKGTHKKEKRFALHDHLYYIKVEPKNDAFPLLINILDFLEQACNYILNEIKNSYELEDNNIGLLTIYQEPMINVK